MDTFRTVPKKTNTVFGTTLDVTQSAQRLAQVTQTKNEAGRQTPQTQVKSTVPLAHDDTMQHQLILKPQQPLRLQQPQTEPTQMDSVMKPAGKRS